jgi:hypothetical protein
MHAAKPTLEKIVRDALRRAPREEAAVWAWPVVCGATVAAKTEALTCVNNRLRVLVPDANWQAQLADFQPHYLAALENLIGIALDGIDFEIAGAKHPPRSDRESN